MIFGSVRKFSTIDYPGKLASVLGTKGCNMNCHWCHNYDLVSFEFSPDCRMISESEILDFLKERIGFLEGVVISGGEPTLHSDLPDFCERVKHIGFAVKLDTNGTNPEMLTLLADRELIDYVAMDVKTDMQNYPALTKNKFYPEKIKQSIDFLLNGPLEYEFRTTCVKPFVDRDKMVKIGEMIKGANHYFLQKFDRSHVSDRYLPEAPAMDFNETEMTDLLSRVKPYVAECRIR